MRMPCRAVSAALVFSRRLLHWAARCCSHTSSGVTLAGDQHLRVDPSLEPGISASPITPLPFPQLEESSGGVVPPRSAVFSFVAVGVTLLWGTWLPMSLPLCPSSVLRTVCGGCLGNMCLVQSLCAVIQQEVFKGRGGDKRLGGCPGSTAHLLSSLA